MALYLLYNVSLQHISGSAHANVRVFPKPYGHYTHMVQPSRVKPCAARWQTLFNKFRMITILRDRAHRTEIVVIRYVVALLAHPPVTLAFDRPIGAWLA